MTDSYTLEKVFRALTGPKFETSFLSSDCLSTGEADFALSEKTPLEILLFIASVSGLRKHFSRYFNQFRRTFINSPTFFACF